MVGGSFRYDAGHGWCGNIILSIPTVSGAGMQEGCIGQCHLPASHKRLSWGVLFHSARAGAQSGSWTEFLGQQEDTKYVITVSPM